MIDKIRYLIYLVCFSNILILPAQDSVIFKYEDFMQQVIRFHPLVRQADLLVQNAQINLNISKSFMDPLLSVSSDNKYFNNKSYYSYQEGSIKWHTKSPVGLSAGWSQNSGENINPEFSPGSFTYMGLEIPLLQGLSIDKRRATLIQAKEFILQSDAERRIAINQILYQATAAYIEWWYSHQQFMIMDRFIRNLENRKKLLTVSFMNGDNSVSDTLDLNTQYQNFLIQQNTIRLNYVNKAIQLSAFLWNENMDTGILAESNLPDSNFEFTLAPTDSLFDFFQDQNPVLEVYNSKLKILAVEKKLKWQSLLPKLDLKSKFFGIDRTIPFYSSNYPVNKNFHVSMHFGFPIFRREALGQYQLTKNKLNETTLLKSAKERELITKLEYYLNEKNLYLTQLDQLNLLSKDLNSLLEMEYVKFRQGESNALLLNIREQKLIDVELKKPEVKAKLLHVIAKARELKMDYKK